jgi:hypothetical protein
MSCGMNIAASPIESLWNVVVDELPRLKEAIEAIVSTVDE